MPLKPCRECKKEVSTEAKTCPHCGATTPTESGFNRRIGAGGGCLIILLVLFMIGMCSDSGTTNPGSLRQSGAASTGATSGSLTSWRSRPIQSEMDGSQGYVVEKDADGAIDKWLGTTTPTLVIRCQENKTSVYVHTETAAQPELGLYDRATVRLRFDDGAPQRQEWSESTDDVALFAPNPIALARRLAKARTFRFQFTPFNAPPAVATFSLEGSDGAISRVADTCGWQLMP